MRQVGFIKNFNNRASFVGIELFVDICNVFHWKSSYVSVEVLVFFDLIITNDRIKKGRAESIFLKFISNKPINRIIRYNKLISTIAITDSFLPLFFLMISNSNNNWPATGKRMKGCNKDKGSSGTFLSTSHSD